MRRRILKSFIITILTVFILFKHNPEPKIKALEVKLVSDNNIEVSSNTVSSDTASSNTVSNNTISDNTVAVSYEDAQILLRIAEAEAGNCSIEERAYIMAVVLNRVEDPNFPDTVEGVVFQTKQFTPVRDGSYYKVEITENTHLALAEIEEGKYKDFEALYFENCKGSSWHSRNLTRVETADTKNRFYK